MKIKKLLAKSVDRIWTVRAKPNGFRVHRLNRSATTADMVLNEELNDFEVGLKLALIIIFLMKCEWE